MLFGYQFPDSFIGFEKSMPGGVDGDQVQASDVGGEGGRETKGGHTVGIGTPHGHCRGLPRKQRIIVGKPVGIHHGIEGASGQDPTHGVGDYPQMGMSKFVGKLADEGGKIVAQPIQVGVLIVVKEKVYLYVGALAVEVPHPGQGVAGRTETVDQDQRLGLGRKTKIGAEDCPSPGDSQ